MSPLSLHQHFIRLWQRCQGQSQQITLDELAALSGCSRRHMRSLLTAMQRQGWLSWQAAAGRGRRSLLCFHYSGIRSQSEQVAELLTQDRIQPLRQLLSDEQFTRLLHASAGFARVNGQTVLRLLTDCPLENLLPGGVLRDAERLVVHHIFSGLLRVVAGSGEVVGDVAYRWRRLSASHWRFWLRPAVRFHDGRVLQMEDVLVSLQRLSASPAGAHVQVVEALDEQTLDVRLQQADCWLPWLLASDNALIMPKEWKSVASFNREPVGCGAFAVTSHTPGALTLQAFNDYFGYRPLLEKVSFWQLTAGGHFGAAGLPLNGPGQGGSIVPPGLADGLSNADMASRVADVLADDVLTDDMLTDDMSENDMLADDAIPDDAVVDNAVPEGVMLNNTACSGLVLPRLTPDSLEGRLAGSLPDAPFSLDNKSADNSLSCYYVLVDGRAAAGDATCRHWLREVLSPVALLCHLPPAQQRTWQLAWGLLPGMAAVDSQPVVRPPGLKTLRVSYCDENADFPLICQAMATVLAGYQVELDCQPVTFAAAHCGEITSDLWLNAASLSPPVAFSMFFRLWQTPLWQRCLLTDWQSDHRRWQAGELTAMQWCVRRQQAGDVLALFHVRPPLAGWQYLPWLMPPAGE